MWQKITLLREILNMHGWPVCCRVPTNAHQHPNPWAVGGGVVTHRTMAEGGRRAAAVEAASQPHVWIPWRCLCLGLVRHTTNSTPPRRRTNLHASHISRNADRTCPHAPPPRVSVRPLSRMIAAACGLKGRQGAPCDTGGVSGTCTRVQCTVETVCRAVVLPSSPRTFRHADDTGSSPCARAPCSATPGRWHHNSIGLEWQYIPGAIWTTSSF